MQVMEPEKVTDILAEAISKRIPLTSSQITQEFHLGMVRLFDILDLKDEYKAKFGLEEVIPTELPEGIPQIKGPRYYFKLADGAYGSISTGSPYLEFYNPKTVTPIQQESQNVALSQTQVI